MIEKRGSPRQNRCFFRAFVYFDGGGTAVDCVVRDISETGARLQFSAPRKISEILDLHIPIKGQSFHAKVRWEDGNEIGIAFHATSNTGVGNIGLDERMNRLEAEIAALRHSVKHLQRNTEQKLQVA
jgi:hypothetical protein